MRSDREHIADARAQRGDHVLDLFIAQHAIQPRALHIQDLAAQRQNCLEVPISRLLG